MNVGNLCFTGMSCGGCAAKVMSAVASLSLAPQVDVNQKRGRVQVHSWRQQAEPEAEIRSLGSDVTAVDR